MAEVAVAELAARITEVYNAFCERVRSLNRTEGRLEVLSLSSLAQGQGRMRTLTSFSVTKLDDMARMHLAELVSLYMTVWSRVAARGEVPTELSLIYMRGQASVNYLTVNLAHGALYLPLSSVLGEASVIYMCAMQLCAALGLR